MKAALQAKSEQLRVTKEEESAYLEAARAWDDDRVLNARRRERTAWWVAGCSATLTLVLGLAIASVLPFKPPAEVFVALVNNNGIVQPLVRLPEAVKTLRQNEALNKYFLVQFVTLRHSYTFQQLQKNFDQLWLFTAPRLREQLKNEWSTASPTSPYAKYGEAGTAAVSIKSTTFLPSSNIAQVRFVLTERDKSGVQTQRHMLANIEFEYVAEPKPIEVVYSNPLGFFVSNYRVDQETPTEEKKL